MARRLRADDVLQTLSELFVEHGPPANLRSDNGPEFTAKVVREWLERVEVKTLYIEPGSPWENGYNESFNGTLGEEVLKREIFYSLEEAKVLIEQWRREYNTIRPHSSLRYRPPAPDPYGDYESLNNARTLFPQGDFDDRRPPKERVLGIPFVDGGGMAFPFNALDSGGDRRVVHSQADGQDIVVFWDRDAKAAVAFRTTVGGQALTFEVLEGRYVDVQSGSEWTLEGRAISGSMEGQRLVQVPEAYVSFWFAWATFVPDTDLWRTQKPVPKLAD